MTRQEAKTSGETNEVSLSREFSENYKSSLSLLHAHSKDGFACTLTSKELEIDQKNLYRSYRDKERVSDTLMNRSYTI
jgi:hypothetical protein